MIIIIRSYHQLEKTLFAKVMNCACKSLEKATNCYLNKKTFFSFLQLKNQLINCLHKNKQNSNRNQQKHKNSKSSDSNATAKFKIQNSKFKKDVTIT